MYDDIPFGFGVTWRWGMELAFDRSPYRHPIGGRDENLLERDREDILAFWRSAYRPDNMTVVVVGDVDPAETLRAARSDKFADPGVDFPGQPSTPQSASWPSPPVEPDHDGIAPAGGTRRHQEGLRQAHLSRPRATTTARTMCMSVVGGSCRTAAAAACTASSRRKRNWSTISR